MNNNILYMDNFLIISIHKNKGFCADCLLGYIEMSPNVAAYIAKKCKENIKAGYKLLELIK